jgi:hypothetical protein
MNNTNTNTKTMSIDEVRDFVEKNSRSFFSSQKEKEEFDKKQIYEQTMQKIAEHNAMRKKEEENNAKGKQPHFKKGKTPRVNLPSQRLSQTPSPPPENPKFVFNQVEPNFQPIEPNSQTLHIEIQQKICREQIAYSQILEHQQWEKQQWEMQQFRHHQWEIQELNRRQWENQQKLIHIQKIQPKFYYDAKGAMHIIYPQ